MACDLDPARVAVILPDMIGTSICALPALASIRSSYPRADVHVLGFARVAELLLDEPVARGIRLIELGDLATELERALAPLAVELVFDFLSIPDSEACLARLGIPHRAGWPNHLEGGGFTIEVPYPGERVQQSTVDYLDFVVAAGGTPVDAPPRLTCGGETIQAAAAWLEQQNVRADEQPLVCFGLGGGNSRKRWPVAHHLDVADHLAERHGARPLFFLGPQEDEVYAQLIAARPDAVVARSLPLDLVKGLIAECAAAVCNDHALMHLAAALGVPTVGIFLASDPHQWFPYEAPSSYVVGPSLECRPCYSEDCPHDWACNDESLVEAVKARVDC